MRNTNSYINRNLVSKGKRHQSLVGKYTVVRESLFQNSTCKRDHNKCRVAREQIDGSVIIPNSTFRLGPTPLCTRTGELHMCRDLCKTPTVYKVFLEKVCI